MAVCYYKVLGISRRASQEEIKSAFRLLAMRWHPDRNPRDPGCAERFKEALEAYETLIDPGRRHQYDRKHGRSGRSKARPRPDRHEERESGEGASVEDVLHEFFGVDRKSGGYSGITDLRFDLLVARSAVEEGRFEELAYTRIVYCRACMSNGRGKALASCPECEGSGEVEETRSIRIKIPEGIRNGDRIRIAGAGDCPYAGRISGDLVVLFHIVEGC